MINNEGHVGQEWGRGPGLERVGFLVFFLGNMNSAYKLKMSLFNNCVCLCYMYALYMYECMFTCRLSGRFS